jgi:hypothetical protein
METREIVDIKEEMMADLHQWLKSRASDKDNSDYYSNGIHCSGLESCERKVVYNYFGLPKKDKTLAELLMFEIANMVHDLMGRWAKESEAFELIGEETVITEGLPEGVSGKSDLLIRHKDSNKTVLVDTKTAREGAFKNMAWLIKPEHELQVNTYRMGYENLKQTIDEMILTYFDRGGSNSPVYVKLNKIDDTYILGRIDTYKKAIKEYGENKIEPPKKPLEFKISETGLLQAKKSWECDYCDFCGVSCDGFPDLDRNIFKSVGKISGDKLVVDPKYSHISAELTRQYNQQQSEGLGIL